MVVDIRDELVESLHHSQQIVANLLEMTADIQDWQREPAEWSFRLTAAHLATIERDCYLDRLTQVASGSHPHFDPFVSTYLDQEGFDLLASLAEWTAFRRQLLDYAASLSDEELRYTGTHDTLGTVTVIDLLKELSTHDDRQFRHVAQLIEDYLEEVSVV
jgi:hypothetical protein